ncbi:MAG: YjfB family protein [Geothrix sp.]|nr:YjfB family protein [Geothrix sp.]
MDITPANAVVQTQARTQNEFAVRVLRKALDLSAEQGADLARMVAQAGGVGQRVDLYA